MTSPRPPMPHQPAPPAPGTGSPFPTLTYGGDPNAKPLPTLTGPSSYGDMPGDPFHYNNAAATGSLANPGGDMRPRPAGGPMPSQTLPSSGDAENLRLATEAADRQLPNGTPAERQALIAHYTSPDYLRQIGKLPSSSTPAASTSATGSGYTPPGDLTGHTFTGHAPAATPYGDFVGPNPADVSNDPYYQFRAAEGQKALEHSAAARGTLIGGGQLKALERYRQGLASEEAGKAFDRALTTYGTNRDTNQQNFGQSTTQFRGDLDIFDANNRSALAWKQSDRADADANSTGAPSDYSAAPQSGLSDYAAMVAQLRQQQQQRAANPPPPPANNRPGWIDRGLDVPSYRGPSTGGGIGRRAL